jgi:hypothetical protein
VPNLVREELVAFRNMEHDGSSFDLFIDLIRPSKIKAIHYRPPSAHVP